MKRYEVMFYVNAPDEATETEVEAWVRFEVGETCSLSGDNPMVHFDLKGESVDVRQMP